MTGNLEMVVIFLIPIASIIGLTVLLSVAIWARERRRERETLFRHELDKKLIEKGELDAARLAELAREEAERRWRSRREGLRLAGFVISASGLGLLIAQHFAGEKLDGIGWPPLVLGLVLLLYAYFLAPGRKRM
jgi:hypothetical protein